MPGLFHALVLVAVPVNIRIPKIVTDFCVRGCRASSALECRMTVLRFTVVAVPHVFQAGQRRTAVQIADDLCHVPYEPYAPVRQQMLRILKLVNQSRKAAGLDTLGYDVLRYRRRIVRPFEPLEWLETG